MIKGNFYFNGEPIENVRNYKYLCVIFSASGSFSTAMICIKGGCLHIFDHTIKPILTYGSEIRGTCTFNFSKCQANTPLEIEKKISTFDSENLSLKFYKYILGVNKKSCNLAVMGELGRILLNIDIICSKQRINGLVLSQEPDVQWLSFVDVVHKCFSFLVFYKD